jgi:hypothetical protein
MNGTNVDYYVSGFDTAGKRVGSIICDFDPNKDKNVEKLAALKEKAKTLFTDAAVVDVVSAADYNQYLTGEYVRGADGKPTAYIAPEPTAAEKKASAIATIKAKYQTTLETLVEARVKAAMLGADTSKIDSQYKNTLANMAAEIKNA